MSATPAPVGRPAPNLTMEPLSYRRIVVRVATVTAVVATALVVAATPAAAQAEGPSLNDVINNLRNWLVTLLAALATLFLTVGGLRYMAAGGDPAQVERAKTALRSAALGYALAALAPLLVAILRSIVGGN